MFCQFSFSTIYNITFLRLTLHQLEPKQNIYREEIFQPFLQQKHLFGKIRPKYGALEKNCGLKYVLHFSTNVGKLFLYKVPYACLHLCPLHHLTYILPKGSKERRFGQKLNPQRPSDRSNSNQTHTALDSNSNE